jgi:glycerol kinase
VGLPVRRPALVETTALGAAGLAGIAEGVWESSADFLAAQGEADQFEPEMEPDDAERLREGWNRAVRAVRAWASDRGP